jgi:hypothetical protein
MQFSLWQEMHARNGSGSNGTGLGHQGIVGASGMNTTPSSASESRRAGVNCNAAKRRDITLETNSNRHRLWLDCRGDNPAFLQPTRS